MSAENRLGMGICKLESCKKPFQKVRNFMEFCSAECRGVWNGNRYCGHRRLIENCAVPGCEAHALLVTVLAFKAQFMQCDCGCGRWFERKPGKRFFAAPCRWKAKDDAEKARRAKLEARRAARLAKRMPSVPSVPGVPDVPAMA